MTAPTGERADWTAADVVATRFRNGFVAVPVLHGLEQVGVLHTLDERRGVSLADLCGVVGQHGAVSGCLRTLALLGWVEMHGSGQPTIVRLTSSGRAVRTAFRAARQVIGEAMEILRWVPALSKGAGRQQWPDALLELLERLTARRRADWHTESPELRVCLDGLILSPLLVAFGRAEVSVPDPAHSAGWELLAAAGLAERDSDDVVIRPLGRELIRAAADFGVILSYADTLANLTEALRGRQWNNSRSDADVYRDLNIWGSAETRVTTRIRRRLLDHVLVPLFDTDDPAQQPAGIIDVGCGSGEPLLEMAELVLTRTRRGRQLPERPLVLVGTDISPTACARTAELLREIADRPDITVLVVRGDVADPDALDREVRAATGRDGRPVGLADLLHTQMFLLHDRELSLPPDRAHAEHRLADLIETLDDDVLRDNACRLIDEPGTVTAAQIAEQFTVDQALRGELIPAVVVAVDLAVLMARWRPYLRHGLLMIEAHVPRLSDLSTDAIDAGIDPAPSVWAVHTASGQYLMPYLEHELAMGLAGVVPAFSTVTGTGGISAAHWLDNEVVYDSRRLSAVPEFAFADPGSD